MFGKRFPHFKDEKKPAKRYFNIVFRELERLGRLSVTAPLVMSDGPTGPIISFPAGPPVLFAVSPGGGIAAGSSATCTIKKDNGSGGLTNDTRTETIWNNYTSAVGASKLITAVFFDGRWRVLTEAC